MNQRREETFEKHRPQRKRKGGGRRKIFIFEGRRQQLK